MNWTPILTNWKTTVFGILAGLPYIVEEIAALTDNDPSTVMDPNRLVMGVAIVLGLAQARDWNKSSQDNDVRP